ncbi:hypothetical protein [Chamaesiphon sp.]|uniref:hypothetical protein n=1 Tax=Chamaesiphon sp. TaxID=2814140 RepID=UPI0035946712
MIRKDGDRTISITLSLFLLTNAPRSFVVGDRLFEIRAVKMELITGDNLISQNFDKLQICQLLNNCLT